MHIGTRIRNLRQARDLSQKEVALSLGMDQSQYSRIETGKTDPSFSTVERIVQTLDIGMAELFEREPPVVEVNSYIKATQEKLRLIEELEEADRQAVFRLIDGLVSKRRLMVAMSAALQQVA